MSALEEHVALCCVNVAHVLCESPEDAFTKYQQHVLIIFKIYQSCMNVRKQYVVGSAEQIKTNTKN